MRETEFEFIRSLVYERSRIHLSRDKRELVSARLSKRLRATNQSSLGAYCQLLQSPGADEELGHLIDAISTNHTFFFREPAHFDYLRDTIVPALDARARTERWSKLRIWSAACSSGEEPYTIAMVLAASAGAWPWEIEATDISRRVLAKAQLGIYRAESVQRLPPALVRRCFQRGIGPQEGNHRVIAELRSRVTFRHLNLLAGDPPFAEPFQVIFCRNVMIYFDQATQEELVARLTRRLVPGGYLLVGHAESLTHLQHGLQLLRPAVYQRPLSA